MTHSDLARIGRARGFSRATDYRHTCPFERPRRSRQMLKRVAWKVERRAMKLQARRELQEGE